MELQMEHCEVGPELGTEFQIEVFSTDNPHFSSSHSMSEVVIDEESDSDDLVVDHDFGRRVNVAEPDESSGSDAEFPDAPAPIKPRTVIQRRRTEEPHLCIVCGKVCMSISGLKVHQKVHMRDSSLDCNICNMTFPSRAAQSAHMLVHNPEKTHECPCCPLRFASDRALQSHYRVRHKGSDTAVVPKLKAATLPRPKSPPLLLTPPPPQPSYALPRRQSSAKKTKPKSKKKSGHDHRMPVPEVTVVKHKQVNPRRASKLNRKAFLAASPGEKAMFLKQVIQESQGPIPAASSSRLGHDGRPQVYRCNICKKGFRELHFLERHISIHMMAKQHKCPLCEETFESARAVNSHATEAHGSGAYICSVCGKNLHKLGSLLNHQLLHEKNGEMGGTFTFAK